METGQNGGVGAVAATETAGRRRGVQADGAVNHIGQSASISLVKVVTLLCSVVRASLAGPLIRRRRDSPLPHQTPNARDDMSSDDSALEVRNFDFPIAVRCRHA
jgi:hypothetical protein